MTLTWICALLRQHILVDNHVVVDPPFTVILLQINQLDFLLVCWVVLLAAEDFLVYIQYMLGNQLVLWSSFMSVFFLYFFCV